MTNRLSLLRPFELALLVKMSCREGGESLFTILYVAIPLRNRLLSYSVLQFSSDLRVCEQVPDGLPRMVRIALFCTLPIWSDSCLKLGSQTVGQYSRWGKTSDRYNSRGVELAL